MQGTNLPAAKNASLPTHKWHAHMYAAQAELGVASAAHMAAAAVDPSATGRTLAGDKSRGTIPPGMRPSDVGAGGRVRLRSRAGGASLEWAVRRAAEPGAYILDVSGKVLRADQTGKGVAPASSDAGTGLHRWQFFEVGDDSRPEYVIRVAGGKADDYVYLGADDAAPLGVRLFKHSGAAEKRWTARFSGRAVVEREPEPDADATPDAEPGADAATGGGAGSEVPHIPTGVSLGFTGLSDDDVDTVLRLISLPENGTPKWYDNYGYIEFLGDGRGFTVTIFGACSGTGDLSMILDELAKVPGRSETCDELLRYAPAMKKKKGDDIRGIEGIKPLVERLQDDPAWRRAVWAVYVKLYWKFAMEWADKTGAAARRPGPKLRLPASRGFCVDAAINHGANYESLMTIVKRMPADARESSDETTWVSAFADAREKMLASGYDDLDTSRTGDRCKLWKELVRKNPHLKKPFHAYEGYWGDFTIR